MRFWGFGAAGFLGGFGASAIAMLAIGDSVNLLVTVAAGFFAAVVVVLVAAALESASRLSGAWRERERARRIRVRKESSGSFSDRLTRYSSNAKKKPSADEELKSKMKLWVFDETAVFERTPPKPIGMIRVLLLRIRRILSGS